MTSSYRFLVAWMLYISCTILSCNSHCLWTFHRAGYNPILCRHFPRIKTTVLRRQRTIGPNCFWLEEKTMSMYITNCYRLWPWLHSSFVCGITAYPIREEVSKWCDPSATEWSHHNTGNVEFMTFKIQRTPIQYLYSVTTRIQHPLACFNTKLFRIIDY